MNHQVLDLVPPPPYNIIYEACIQRFRLFPLLLVLYFFTKMDYTTHLSHVFRQNSLKFTFNFHRSEVMTFTFGHWIH